MTEVTTAATPGVTSLFPDAAAPAPRIPAPDIAATAKLDALTKDSAWADRFLAGGVTERKQFDELVAAIHAPPADGGGSHDRLDQIIAGTATDGPLIETVSPDNPLTTRVQMAMAAELREMGIPHAAIRQLFEGKPVSKSEYEVMKNLRAARMSDPDWRAKWLAGDPMAQREFLLTSIALTCGVKSEAA